MSLKNLKVEFRTLLNNINADFERLESLEKTNLTDFEAFASNLDALYKKGIVFAYVNSIDTNLQTIELNEHKVIEKPIQFSDLLKEAENKQIENAVIEAIEPIEKEVIVETTEIIEPTTIVADLKEEEIIVENPVIEEGIKAIDVEPDVKKEPTLNLVDIKSGIGINDKFQFISELFANNVERYESAIKKLNADLSFENSLSTLEELKKENNWKDESESAQRLFEIVKRRFL